MENYYAEKKADYVLGIPQPRKQTKNQTDCAKTVKQQGCITGKNLPQVYPSEKIYAYRNKGKESQRYKADGKSGKSKGKKADSPADRNGIVIQKPPETKTKERQAEYKKMRY